MLQLQLPIEEYFRYHPPTTEERKAKHEQANAQTLAVCKELIARCRNGTPIQPHHEDGLTRLLMGTVRELTKDEHCQSWAFDAIDRMFREFRHSQNEVSVLMHCQQIRMFLNQGITIDELVAKSNA